MPEKNLHIISFDIPYPPNYGGVIDVYYKIAELHRLGVKVHLHCFEYPGRDRKEELLEICSTVHYYPRMLGFRQALSTKPYIVNSRKSDELINNLLKDEYPILFEGLHSCYYLNDDRLKDRFRIYRESNIEHHYYFHLFLSDKKIFSKIYYLVASLKLYLYQKVLKHANLIIAVSQKDTEYLRKHTHNVQVEYLPSFHGNGEVECRPGSGKYILYHGNLEIPENEKASAFLIKKVFSDLEIPFIVAGMKPTQRLSGLCSKYGIRLVRNPGHDEMVKLIQNAHVNLLYTFQDTGLKLKLINALYKGRHCLANKKMLNGSGLDNLCHTANTAQEMRHMIKKLMETPFTKEMAEYRFRELNSRSEEKNAKKLVDLIFTR